MSYPLTSVEPVAKAKGSLIKQLYPLFSALPYFFDEQAPWRIIRLEVPIACAPLEWLSWQSHSTKLYWSNRQSDFEAAGIGCADKIICTTDEDYAAVLKKLKHNLHGHTGKARYYGGLRFDPKAPVERCWRPYGACFFILPRFEVYTDTTGTGFACNILLEAGRAPGDLLAALLEALEQVRMDGPAMHSFDRTTPLLARQDIPPKDQWLRNVAAALATLETGTAAKIVLGRSTVLAFDRAPQPLFLLDRLKAIEPFAYHFYFQPEAGFAFVGATPERLYRRRKSGIDSEAVAGTCRRGATPEQDRALGEALLRSDKERREHLFVRHAIQAALTGCCRYLETGGSVQLLKQSRVQHLYSRIQGRLLDPVTDLELLQRLHPTPAVGGLPRERALQAIAQLETFDRGWFAGPVGWIGHDRAEFAVGIRSAMVSGKSVRLFAGAGLVQGSIPESEWDEVEAKMSVFMEALGIESH